MNILLGAIPFMVGCVNKALVSTKRRHRGFTPTELTEGLARMAVNDANKLTVKLTKERLSLHKVKCNLSKNNIRHLSGNGT